MTAQKAQCTPLEKVRVLQRKLYRAAKAQPQRTFGVLFDKVCRLDVLWFAWEQVRRNCGAAGVDGETIESIGARGALWFLLELREELVQQRYRPQLVRRVFIPKPDGRQRPLGIPGVKDRVAQAAVKIVIEPLFEASFRPGSYGFRPKRSAKQAIYDIRKWVTYLGMNTRRTGWGRYRCCISSSRSSRRNHSVPLASIDSIVSPSTPAAPRLRRTCSHANHNTSKLQTLSNRTPNVRCG